MSLKSFLTTTAFILSSGVSSAAWADNVAHCEIVLLETVENESGEGEAQIASYRPAATFLASLYDEEEGHMTHINDHPIRAVLCKRNNVIPAKSDYDIIATGIPFGLSQDFDSPDTDSLTLIWKEQVLDYIYKGHPLSDEAQATLDSRLEDFNTRGLNSPTPEVERSTEAKIDMADNSETDFVSSADVKETIEITPKTDAELDPVSDVEAEIETTFKNTAKAIDESILGSDTTDLQTSLTEPTSNTEGKE